MSLALHSEKMWHAFWKMHWECHFSNSYQLTLKLLNQPGTNLNRFLIFIMFFLIIKVKRKFNSKAMDYYFINFPT